MPANLVSAVVVGRLLEDRYRLERRDAFLYALAPQLAGMPEAPAIAVSIALGRRNEPPPPPPPPDTGKESQPGEVVAGEPVDQPTHQPGTQPAADAFPAPNVIGKSRSDLDRLQREDERLLFQVEGPANGTVAEQQPKPEVPIRPREPIHVKMGPGK